MSDFDTIPKELRRRDQWLMWDASADTPRRPHWKGNFTISWSDPDAWHSFEDAVEAANEKESWGIGYVTALDNDDHARGIYGVIDIDGGNRETGAEKLKEWVPSLQPFVDDGAYIEFSPSGDGLHIPFVGHTPPDWWADCQLGDHEGVDVLTNKFCTFTGNAASVSGTEVTDVDPEPWLYEAYEGIKGESPEPQTTAEETVDRSSSYSSDDEWLDDDLVADALDHIDADCAYPEWRNVAFAVHDYDPGVGGKGLFESWSRGGTKWDKDSSRYINAIWEKADQGSGVTVGTLVHKATQNGWEPFDGRRSKPSFDASQEDGTEDGQTAAETDGGTAAASQPDDDRGDDRGATGRSERPLRERVREHVSMYEADEEMAKSTVIYRTALDILDEHDFVHPPEDARGWRHTLYRYDPDEGIYTPDGERFLGELAERLLGDFLTNQQVRELVGRVTRLSGVERDEIQTPPNRLVVANGIVDLHTGELDEWTADEYHRTKLDVPYDPDAECPRIDEFFHEIVRDNDVRTLYQLAAHCLYREYLNEKAAMLVGDGQNGKSVFLSLLVEFLGEHNVSHRSLQDLDGERFAANSLEGKLANLHPDMGDESVRDLGTFKKLTGRDTMTADVKYEKPIQFENHATLIFAANRMPAMQEDTHALWRRWIYLNFPFKFSDDDPGAKDPVPKRVLMRELTDEAEMQGLLSRCVDEISAWWDGRDLFDDVMPPSEVRKKMKRASEPIYDFAVTCLEPADDDDWLKKEDVRQCYREYARQEDLPTQPDNVFVERLLGVRDLQLESAQRRENGQRVTAYTGVQFSSRGRQVLGLDEPDDGGQSTVGGSGAKGRRRDITEIVRELTTDGEGVSEDMVKGRAAGQMDINLAERTIEDALKHGNIYRDEDGLHPSD